jgi:hypothetical protein
LSGGRRERLQTPERSGVAPAAAFVAAGLFDAPADPLAEPV